MEKKILIKLRRAGVITLIVSLVILFSIKVVTLIAGYGFDVSQLLYLISLLFIATISTYGFSGRLLLPVGLFFYALGSLLFVLTLTGVSEFVLRLSIIFFLVGIVRAFFEYKNAKK